MHELAEKLAANPWLILGATIFTIVGFGATIYSIYLTVYLSRRTKRLPRYVIRSIPVLADITTRVPELTMRYSGYGQAINNLTVSKLLIWNAGESTIKKEDIPSSDPLLVSIDPQYSILQVRVIRVANPASRFEAKLSRKDRSHASLSFDFLDFNQPVLIEIVHTGKGDKDLSLQGQVIGGGSFVAVPHEQFVSHRRRRYNVIAALAERQAAFLVRRRNRLLYGVAFIALSALTLVHSIINVYHYMTELEPNEAWNTTMIEFMIFGTSIYYFSTVGYFILGKITARAF